MSVFPEVRVVHAGANGRSWSDRALVEPTPTTGRHEWPGLPTRLKVDGAGGVGTVLRYAEGHRLGPHLLNNWPASRKVTVP